jgi:hypothetical protein
VHAQSTGERRFLKMSNNPIARLANLLAASGAQPVITPERFAPSTLYDLEYRVLVVVTAFQLHAAPDRFSSRPRIQNRRLKLLQFTAMRPWLVPVIRSWSLSRPSAERLISGEEGERRGFFNDTMHERVLDFLVAAGALRREELYVIPGVRPSVIFDLYSLTEQNSLFQAEFAALNELKHISITNQMLEGW